MSMPKEEKSGLWRLYRVSPDGKLERLASFCPICGTGYIMARHADRYTCGRCGYTSFIEAEKRPR